MPMPMGMPKIPAPAGKKTPGFGGPSRAPNSLGKYKKFISVKKGTRAPMFQKAPTGKFQPGSKAKLGKPKKFTRPPTLMGKYGGAM